MKQNKKVMVYFAGVWIFLLLLFQFGPQQSLRPFRTNELELFQGNISQDLLFIDMPTLDLKPYQVNQYPFLPPLYLGLPSDIPYNVQVFLEKRNKEDRCHRCASRRDEGPESGPRGRPGDRDKEPPKA